MGEIKPKYDFYENDMFLDDPINADLKRKKRVCAPKIGTEPRVRKIFELTVMKIDARNVIRTKPWSSSVCAQGQT